MHVQKTEKITKDSYIENNSTISIRKRFYTNKHTIMHTITCNTCVTLIAYIYIYQGSDCLLSKGQKVKIKLKGVTQILYGEFSGV